jgi:lipopolysaccharide heptosyltransferase I
MNILIVRLGALGDIIHAVPAAAALRLHFPDARIDWLVDAKHREMLDLVTVLDRAVVLESPTLAGWTDGVRRLRAGGYDVAIDFQGLLKSAVLARASGASRVLGFSIWHLREKTARPFYSETDGHAPDQVRLQPDPHVIYKNLRLLRTLGVADETIRFPLAAVVSPALARVREAIGALAPFALINPGAAWPNKRWPPERFGEVASFLRDVRGLVSIVLWGPGEEPIARAVVDASSGAARLAPRTLLADVLTLARAATLVISGDTGPLHIAAAAGTPVVALFGPTDPARNGPWSPDDVVVSRFAACGCHYDRRCHEASWCLADVSVTEVTAAVQRRLASAGNARPASLDGSPDSARRSSDHDSTA